MRARGYEILVVKQLNLAPAWELKIMCFKRSLCAERNQKTTGTAEAYSELIA